MQCGRCGTDWTEGAWYGDKVFPYVHVCEACFRRPGDPDALTLALEHYTGVKRVIPGQPRPRFPDVCAHSVPLHVEFCADCKRMAGDVRVRDVKDATVTFSPRFLTESWAEFPGV